MYKEPTSTEDYLEIPDKHSKLQNGLQWVQHKGTIQVNGGSEKPFVVMYTDEGIARLKDNKNWIMDGTFRGVPDPFYQLLTIGILVKEQLEVNEVQTHIYHYIPCVYILTPSKAAAVYLEILRSLIKDAACPERLYVDFEGGPLAAVRKLNSDGHEILISACIFHWKCSLGRNIELLGLKPLYCTDEQFKTLIKGCVALAYIELKDVKDWWEVIKDGFEQYKGDIMNEPDYLVTMERIDKFVAYFQKTYIGDQIEETEDTEENEDEETAVETAMFPPCVWNKEQEVRLRLPTTSNCIEGWHAALHMSTKKNMSYWTFLDLLRAREGDASLKYLELEQNRLRARNTKRTLARTVKELQRCEVLENFKQDSNFLAMVNGLFNNGDLELKINN